MRRDRSKEVEASFEKVRDVKRSIYRIWDVIEDDVSSLPLFAEPSRC